MPEKVSTNAETCLEYAPPVRLSDASGRRMFTYLLPGAICVGAIAGSWMIEASFPNGDSRNILGTMCALVMAPLGLAFGVVAILEASRPRGIRALIWGLCWNAVVASGPLAALWFIVRFRLLRGA